MILSNIEKEDLSDTSKMGQINSMQNFSRFNHDKRVEQSVELNHKVCAEVHQAKLKMFSKYLKNTSGIGLLYLEDVVTSQKTVAPKSPLTDQEVIAMGINLNFAYSFDYVIYQVRHEVSGVPLKLEFTAPSINIIHDLLHREDTPEKKYIIQLFDACVKKTAKYQGYVSRINLLQPVYGSVDLSLVFQHTYDVASRTYHRWNAITPKFIEEYDYLQIWKEKHQVEEKCCDENFEIYRIYEQVLGHYVSIVFILL